MTDIQGAYHGNPLQIAAAKSDAECVRLLLDRGADRGYPGRPIQVIGLHGHLGIVKTLVDNGIDITSNVERNIGIDPLHAAISQNQQSVVDFLLD